MEYSDKTYTAIPKLVLTLLKCDGDLLCFTIMDSRAFISCNFFSLQMIQANGEIVKL